MPFQRRMTEEIYTGKPIANPNKGVQIQDEEKGRSPGKDKTKPRQRRSTRDEEEVHCLNEGSSHMCIFLSVLAAAGLVMLVFGPKFLGKEEERTPVQYHVPSFSPTFVTLNPTKSPSAIPSASPTGYTDVQRTALLEFFDSTNGRGWLILYEWNIFTDICGFSGITCRNGTSDIIEIDLQSSNVIGPISSYLGNITTLEKLDLEFNNITGSVPEELCDLSDNYGTIITVDESVHCDCCSFGQRDILTDFYGAARGNMWKNSTKWLTPAPVCEWFGIKCDSDGSISRIELNNNSLSGGNALDTLTHLDTVRLIDLENNALKGTIPTDILSMKDLQVLDIRSNSMSFTIPTEVGLLKDMSVLLLDRNRFSQTVPSELGLLTSLRKFDVENNKMRGSIPSEFGNCLELEHFNAGRNSMTSSIPSELGMYICLYSRNNQQFICGARLSIFDIVGNSFNY